MKKDHYNIVKLSKEFTSECIRTEDPAGLCFATSFPLLIYLATKQIKSQIRTGKVPKILADGISIDVDHFWLQIDKEGTILDPTIQQFKEDQEPIFIGMIQDNEVTEKYKPCDLPSYLWFPEVYRDWKTPFVDPTYPLEVDTVKRNIKYTIRLATILNAEIKKMSLQDDFIDRHLKLYLRPIYIFLYNWHTGKINFELVNEKIPYEFANLLSDALLWSEQNH